MVATGPPPIDPSTAMEEPSQPEMDIAEVITLSEDDSEEEADAEGAMEVDSDTNYMVPIPGMPDYKWLPPDEAWTPSAADLASTEQIFQHQVIPELHRTTTLTTPWRLDTGYSPLRHGDVRAVGDTDTPYYLQAVDKFQMPLQIRSVQRKRHNLPCG